MFKKTKKHYLNQIKIIVIFYQPNIFMEKIIFMKEF
ncbi:MAG: hypothetical protein HEEMFOPI_01495 [Holosporales bacterium]